MKIINAEQCFCFVSIKNILIIEIINAFNDFSFFLFNK